MNMIFALIVNKMTLLRRWFFDGSLAFPPSHWFLCTNFITDKLPYTDLLIIVVSVFVKFVITDVPLKVKKIMSLQLYSKLDATD